jgi:hypothetical protein
MKIQCKLYFVVTVLSRKFEKHACGADSQSAVPALMRGLVDGRGGPPPNAFVIPPLSRAGFRSKLNTARSLLL